MHCLNICWDSKAEQEWPDYQIQEIFDFLLLIHFLTTVPDLLRQL
jgi:hypothetical protein